MKAIKPYKIEVLALRINKMIYSFKLILRSAKDRLLPGRKKRKEIISNLGNHVTQLQEQVDECHQSTQANQHGLQELGQRIFELQSQLLAEIACQSVYQSSLVQALSQQVEQANLRAVESENRHAAAAADRVRHQAELDCVRKDLEQFYPKAELDRLRKDLEQIHPNIKALADRIESRLTLVEATAQVSQPVLDSLQPRFDELDQRLMATNNQLSELNSKMEQQRQSLLQEPVTPPPVCEPPAICREKTLSAVPKSQVTSPEKKSRFCPASYDHYSQMDSSTPFVYLDVKSVPRSGLHYLQRNLQSILGKHLSFCEWYQEPGCCKQMPCAVTGFAKSCDQQGSGHLRMIKSHDFDLADPIFPTNQVLRRILLIRDPIYSLTSYWNLQALKHNQELLKANGINPMKIDYLHEKPVLQMAYSLIDTGGSVPSQKALLEWLEQTKKYMLGFIGKWGRHVPQESVIRYEHVDEWVKQLVEELNPGFPTEVTKRFADWSAGKKDRFQPRANPFFSVSDRLNQNLKQYAGLFERFSAEIKEEDPTG